MCVGVCLVAGHAPVAAAATCVFLVQQMGKKKNEKRSLVRRGVCSTVTTMCVCTSVRRVQYCRSHVCVCTVCHVGAVHTVTLADAQRMLVCVLCMRGYAPGRMLVCVYVLCMYALGHTE